MLNITKSKKDNTTICKPEGDLDAYTVGKFRTTLGELEDEARIIIDLTEVPFMDSAGLGALIGYMRRARENKHRVAVTSSRPAITRLLHTTGFDRLVPVNETLEESFTALDNISFDDEG